MGPFARRVKDAQRQRIEQNDEGNKRQDRVGRHAEGKGMHLAVEQVGDERRAIFAPLVPLRLRDRLSGSGSRGRQGFSCVFHAGHDI